MKLLIFAAFFVGFFHSLVPGHWLPIVLVSKSRKWDLKHSAFAAFVTSCGHIFTALLIAIATYFIGATVLHEKAIEYEEKSGLIMVFFGIIYSAYSLVSHKDCHGHEHHGPAPKKKGSPYYFLFSIGLSPCLAVLPVYGTALAYGNLALVLCLAMYSIGVMCALMMSSLLVGRGLIKLDIPILEHHGDVLTGLAVAFMGAVLLILPHSH